MEKVKILTMLKAIRKMVKNATLEIDNAESLSDLEEIKLKYLGRAGEIQTLMGSLRYVDAKDRPKVGGRMNEAKKEIVRAIENSPHEYPNF
jgi:phenylalanyl-tRNA synthetase alpha chain